MFNRTNGFCAKWKTQNVSECLKQSKKKVNNVHLELNLLKKSLCAEAPMCEFGLFVLRESSLFSQAEIDHLKKYSFQYKFIFSSKCLGQI